MKSLRERLDELQKELEAHAGWKAHVLWDNHILVYRGIYLLNRVPLQAHIQEPSHNDGLSHELMQNVHEPIVKEAYTRELLRLLHNYLAGAFTLVDHSRNLIKGYANTTFEDDYKSRLETIKTSEVHLLIQDVRNYFLHYSVPPIGWRIGLNNGSYNSFEAHLSKEKLKEWSGLSKASKQYLTKSDSTLDLAELIAAHGKVIDDFNNWLHSQFFDLHGADIAAVNELIKHRNGVLDGSIPRDDLE